MAKFRKKPVVVEAWRWDGTTEQKDRPDWLNAAGAYLTFDTCLVIPTLEGELLASPDDWIIQGVKGEIYPCKPDIFWQTYEAWS